MRARECGEERLGWLSPSGDFYPCGWGAHSTEAERILSELGLFEDFLRHSILNVRDYLSGRGYCLIHSPGRERKLVTHLLPLTRAQRDFLYDYFTEDGDRQSAEHYLEAEF